MKTENLDRYFASQFDKGIAGCSFAMMLHGKLVYENYSGYADIEAKKPITPDTMFRMYSMTKLFTCTALLQLYEKGLFNLADPLYKYLPEFRSMQVAVHRPNGIVELEEARNPILVENIMSMTSGLTYDNAPDYASREFHRILGELTAQSLNDTTEQYVKAAAKAPLAFEPGTHWRYGTSHEVVGRLVEVLSGERFSDYVDRHIFKPLGMNDTAFRFPKEVRDERRAKFYDYKNGVFTVNDREDRLYEPDALMDRGGAGAISTLGDYLKFAEALRRGGTSAEGVRILAPETVRLYASDRLTPAQRKDFDWLHMRCYGYGLGVRVMTDPWMDGGVMGEFGWTGKAGTMVYIDPATGLSAVYMEQAAPSLEPDHLPQVRNLIYTAIS